jgi:hypothetical protein
MMCLLQPVLPPTGVSRQRFDAERMLGRLYDRIVTSREIAELQNSG